MQKRENEKRSKNQKSGFVFVWKVCEARESSYSSPRSMSITLMTLKTFFVRKLTLYFFRNEKLRGGGGGKMKKKIYTNNIGWNVCGWSKLLECIELSLVVTALFNKNCFHFSDKNISNGNEFLVPKSKNEFFQWRKNFLRGLLTFEGEKNDQLPNTRVSCS
jgi:hypothetical protein